MHKLSLIFALLFLSSCRTQLVESRVETITYRDTIVNTLPDSALLSAYLECDSTGNVLLKEIVRLTTDTGVHISLDLNNNELLVKSVTDTIEHTIVLPERTVTIERERIVYKSPWYIKYVITASFFFFVLSAFILTIKR